MDGDLRSKFRSNLPRVHWLSIETGGTEPGVADLNGCLDGVEFWLECKKTAAWAVEVKPSQVAFHTHRWRCGGRTYVAVRRVRPSGARTTACDELYLLRGTDIATLRDAGLSEILALGTWKGGPAMWDWEAMLEIMTS
jgi:hypothetical protein